jgi:hypothetical protein
VDVGEGEGGGKEEDGRPPSLQVPHHSGTVAGSPADGEREALATNSQAPTPVGGSILYRANKRHTPSRVKANLSPFNPRAGGTTPSRYGISFWGSKCRMMPDRRASCRARRKEPPPGLDQQKSSFSRSRFAPRAV